MMLPEQNQTHTHPAIGTFVVWTDFAFSPREQENQGVQENRVPMQICLTLTKDYAPLFQINQQQKDKTYIFLESCTSIYSE